MNPNDLLVKIAAHMKDIEVRREISISYAKKVFEPFKKIFKKKTVTGILWWKKVTYEKDISICYHSDEQNPEIVIVQFNFTEYSEDFHMTHVHSDDLKNYLERNHISKDLEKKFISLYHSGRAYTALSEWD